MKENICFRLDPWDENTPDEYQEDYTETWDYENTEMIKMSDICTCGTIMEMIAYMRFQCPRCGRVISC